ncbi:MAG TPA: hypothetical protein VLK36_13315 [Gaiellaceae bacterium]|nr:hypothetical protein [Gaiellaceae bacterium]
MFTATATSIVSSPRRLVALVLAAGALLVAPAAAYAQDNGPTDPGVRCAAKVGPGQYEFYLPGERATDVNGNKWVCGADGQWFRDYSAIIRTPVTQIVSATTTVKFH